MTPEERIAELEAENARQREQIAALVARVQELEARLAKDSHNSGKPPSSDGLARKTKSLRKKSGKKPGGQLGHRGETLRLVAVPDVVEEHRPQVCSACQAPLDAQAPVVLRERRQVQDVNHQERSTAIVDIVRGAGALGATRHAREGERSKGSYESVLLRGACEALRLVLMRYDVQLKQIAIEIWSRFAYLRRWRVERSMAVPT